MRKLILTSGQLDAYRHEKWRMAVSRQIRTEKEAVKFLNEVGFCLLFACDEIPLPKMSLSAYSKEWDWWAWKDTLQVKKLCYNSRAIRKKAALLSMEILPCFVNLYYASGGVEVYEEEFDYGKLTRPAYDIADYLYQNGPQNVADLRRAIFPHSKQGTRKFHAALQELQLKYKVAVSGLVDKSWGMRVVDLFSHWAPPEILKEAEFLTAEESRQRILRQLLKTSGALVEKDIQRLLGWEPADVQSTLASLLDAGELLSLTQKGEKVPLITAPDLVKYLKSH